MELICAPCDNAVCTVSQQCSHFTQFVFLMDDTVRFSVLGTIYMYRFNCVGLIAETLSYYAILNNSTKKLMPRID